MVLSDVVWCMVGSFLLGFAMGLIADNVFGKDEE